MKKKLFHIFILLIAFSSCEKDDICIKATTPMLVIRFYDINNPETTKSVNSLTVWAINKDSIYENKATDSIAIPLNLNENNTIYKLQSGTFIDEISFNYDRNDIFVSRSCGYKTIFENLSIQTSNIWIKEYLINNSTIENETSAHINIYH